MTRRRQALDGNDAEAARCCNKYVVQAESMPYLSLNVGQMAKVGSPTNHFVLVPDWEKHNEIVKMANSSLNFVDIISTIGSAWSRRSLVK